MLELLKHQHGGPCIITEARLALEQSHKLLA